MAVALITSIFGLLILAYSAVVWFALRWWGRKSHSKGDVQAAALLEPMRTRLVAILAATLLFITGCRPYSQDEVSIRVNDEFRITGSADLATP